MPLRKPELLTPFELPLPVTKHRSPAQVGPGGLRSLGKPLVLRMSFRDSFTTVHHEIDRVPKRRLLRSLVGCHGLPHGVWWVTPPEVGV